MASLEARVGILEHQMNGNGDIGVCESVKVVYDWVMLQKGKEEADANNEVKASRSRSLIRWIAGGLAIALFSILGGTFIGLWNWLEPPVAAIVQEYYQHHPEAVPKSSVVPTPQLFKLPIKSQLTARIRTWDAMNAPRY
jgi:hypothetical protein